MMKNFTKFNLILATFVVCVNVFAGHGWTRVNYTNSTIFTGIVTVNGLPADTGDVIGIFVNGECRMVSTIFSQNGTSYISAVLHGEKIDTATIKYWSAKQGKTYDVDTTIITSPSNEILEFPIKLKSSEETTPARLLSNNNSISVYPTIAKSTIFVSPSKDLKSIKIINSIGNLVINLNEPSCHTIDITQLSDGIYFVSITEKDGSITTKKIVKN